MKRCLTSSRTRHALTGLLIGACISFGTAVAQQPAAKVSKADIQRGRYLVQITGCNDCHTPGYTQTGGKVDEMLWLTGNTLGYRGPWGTTYPSNLRLVAQNLSEAQWPEHARREWRPPMPWFNLRDMSDQDLRAIYRYIRHLGPAGQMAPAYVPPDQEPKPPFVQFPAPPK